MTKPLVAFQGEPGANSDEACRTYFPDYEPAPYPTFEDAFEAMKSGVCAYGMIPIENSTIGRQGDVHHLLPDSGLQIIGELFKPIHFNLMVNPGVSIGDVRVISSMPFALAQCRGVIKRLGATTEAAGDTAGSARALAESPDPHRAAIAPALAAEIYGLDILERNIEDQHTNTTRFLAMTSLPDPARPAAGVACVTSFVFRVRNVPAALYKAMGGFATNGVNMTKLESYQENGSFTATMFYCEVDGRPEDPAMARALEELAFFCERLEVLGVYTADPFRRTVG